MNTKEITQEKPTPQWLLQIIEDEKDKAELRQMIAEIRNQTKNIIPKTPFQNI